MNIQFRDRPEQAPAASVKTAIADLRHSSGPRDGRPSCTRIWQNAGTNISRPTASTPIRA